MKTNITSFSNIKKTDNWSAEFWTLDTAKEENFDKTLTETEYSILSLYIGNIINNKKFGISTTLLDKIYKYLRETYLENKISEIVFSKTEKTQMNIILLEASKYSKMYLTEERIKLEQKLFLLIELENKI